MRPRQPMAFHQIFREQQISNCRQNRDQQNADGSLALVEQSPDECERAREITFR